jgi:hypothetical protein
MVGGLLIASIGRVGCGDISMHPLLFLGHPIHRRNRERRFVPYRTVLQRETPLNLLGRVTAVGEAAIAIATLAGTPLGAALANVADFFATFLLGGYLVALLALTLVIVRRPRRSRIAMQDTCR